MATRAATNISSAIVAGAYLPLGFQQNGLLMEVWRLGGGTAGDTAAITPQFITDIRTVQTGAQMTHGLSATAANTNITLTYDISQASTSVVFDVWLIGRRE